MPPTRLAPVLAKVKVERVAAEFPSNVSLAADTIVAFGDTALGKPKDPKEAREMIELLTGATHVVITAVVVRCPDRDIDLADVAMSAVRMNVLTPAQIDAYLAS